MTLIEAAQALRAGQVSSAELTEQCLERIEQLNPKLNAFLTITAEIARAQARKADSERRSGMDRGPLHGIPIAHKDLFCTEGVRTTSGSKLFENFVPKFDAAIVERLREAGAVMLGKTSMHEHAYGITCDNPHYGAVHNPWDLARIPGGSSGGSAAAVAAGLCLMAHRQRHGRVDPGTCVLLRCDGHQADLRSGQQVRRAAARLQPGPCGTDRSHRARCGHIPGRDGRFRQARPE